jgi:hypothetical protein
LAVLVGTAAVGVSTAGDSDATGFLGRAGTQLTWNASPIRYLEHTLPALAGCGLDSGLPDDADLDGQLGNLPAGAMVRTYAAPDKGLVGIERAVAAGRRHGSLLTVVLVDTPSACRPPDGSAGAPERRSREWYQGDFERSLMPWAATVVARFADDPTVGMWEIGHLPDMDVTPDDIRHFYDKLGGELKRVDRNHLVASGAMLAGLNGGPEGWRHALASASLDVGTLVDYEMNAGASKDLAEALSVAASLAKPMILAEVGVLASRNGDPNKTLDPDRPAATACVSWASRADRLRAKLEASFATTLAAVGVWSRPAGGWDDSLCSVSAGGEDDPMLRLLAEFVPAQYPGAPTSYGPEAKPDVTTPAPSTASTSPQPTAGVRPAAPTNLTASPGSGKVTLCWTKASGAEAYVIYHRDVTTGEAWYRMPYPITQPCWTGDQFVNGHTYEFRVHGGNAAAGEGPASNLARATPAGVKAAAPTNLTASPGNAKVTLCWTESAGADAYVIYHRDVTAGEAWFRMPYPIVKPCWTGDQFVNGHTYEFRVHAGNSAGESDSSNIANATPRV